MAPQCEVYAEARIAVINGTEYRWSGGLGSVLISHEWYVNEGNQRIIGNIIFVANRVEVRWFMPSVVHWIPIGEFDAEWIRNFRHALFW